MRWWRCFSFLGGEMALLAKLLYGTGMRLMEETAARVAAVVEADAAMGIAAARWRAASPPNSRNLSRSPYRESGLVLGRRGDDGHE